MPSRLFTAGFGLVLTESFMLTTLLWNLVKIAHGPWFFGVTVGIAALLPLPMMGIFNRLSIFPNTRPCRNLMLMTGLSSFGVVLPIIFSDHFDGHVLLPFMMTYFTLAFVLVNQNFETIVAQSVMRQTIDSISASSKLQMITTGGSLMGGSLAGFCIETLGTQAAFIIVLLVYLFAILPLIFFCFPADHRSDYNFNESTANSSQGRLDLSLWKQESFWGILAVSTVIATFNVFLPQYVQVERKWTAMSFGMLDAAAGIGAFLACFAATNRFGKSHLFWLSPLIFVSAGLCFILEPSQGLVALLVGLWGFAFNGLRTLYRERLFRLASDDTSAAKMTNQIVISRTMIETGSPIGLNWVIYYLTPSTAMAWAGSIVGVCFLGIYWVSFTKRW